MDVVRKIASIRDHKLTLDLPEDFNHECVEVIVFPCDPSLGSGEATAKTWQEDFLAISCWDERGDVESMPSWPLQSF